MTDKIAIAEAYYQAISKKDVAQVEKYLHPDIKLLAPLGVTQGKEAVLTAAKRFTTLFNTLTIYTKFSNETQAVVVYDLDGPHPIDKMRAVALMSFEKELISVIELFYDPRPFMTR